MIHMMESAPIATAVILVPMVLVTLGLIWLLERASDIARKRALVRRVRREAAWRNRPYEGGRL